MAANRKSRNGAMIPPRSHKLEHRETPKFLQKKNSARYLRGATKQMNQQFKEQNVDLASKLSYQYMPSALSSGYSGRKLEKNKFN